MWTIHVLGQYAYGVGTTPRAGRTDYDEDSERVVWLRHGTPLSISQFRADVDEVLAPGVAITVVPSHDPRKGSGAGLAELAEALATDGRIDLSFCVRRHTRVPSLAECPDRTMDQHFRSIAVDPEAFRGREVLLLDDIALTGNSVRACAQQIASAGASRVGILVLRRIVTLPPAKVRVDKPGPKTTAAGQHQKAAAHQSRSPGKPSPKAPLPPKGNKQPRSTYPGRQGPKNPKGNLDWAKTEKARELPRALGRVQRVGYSPLTDESPPVLLDNTSRIESLRPRSSDPPPKSDELPSSMHDGGRSLFRSYGSFTEWGTRRKRGTG